MSHIVPNSALEVWPVDFPAVAELSPDDDSIRALTTGRRRRALGSDVVSMVIAVTVSRTADVRPVSVIFRFATGAVPAGRHCESLS